MKALDLNPECNLSAIKLTSKINEAVSVSPFMYAFLSDVSQICNLIDARREFPGT